MMVTAPNADAASTASTTPRHAAVPAGTATPSRSTRPIRAITRAVTTVRSGRWRRTTVVQRATRTGDAPIVTSVAVLTETVTTAVKKDTSKTAVRKAVSAIRTSAARESRTVCRRCLLYTSDAAD